MEAPGIPSARHQISRTIKRCSRQWRASSLLVWLFLVPIAQMSQAQAPIDVDTPGGKAAYVEQLTAKSEAAKTEAELWAFQHGMPVYDDDGYHVRELMALWDGRPVYYMTLNARAAVSLATDRVRDVLAWDLNGEGVAVGIWDSAGVRPSHREFMGADGRPRVTVRDSTVTSAHSTHVAGTIAAAGIDPAAKGMAPRARIESYDWDNDSAQMFSRAATKAGQANAIYVSNHSYGIIAGWTYHADDTFSGHVGWHWWGKWNGATSYDDWFGRYNTIARQWDDVAYQNAYYLAFAAAGNDRDDGPEIGEKVWYVSATTWREITFDPTTCPPGDGQVKEGYDTLSGPSVAKNVMTVGAVGGAISEELRSCRNATMAEFSSWGPTDDGRIKPDIVANGIQVYSCEDDSDDDYATYDGTSMASPAAAGSAALLVQHYGRFFPGQAMRSSTLKALILHTADDLGPVGPDYQYGWGLMNTRAAAELIQEQSESTPGKILLERFLDRQKPTDTCYLFADGSRPIRITLCWTDPPASAASFHDDNTPRLIHDLDLRLIGPDGSPTYYPYVLNPANPGAVARTGDNKLDNVEQIYVAAPSQTGIYEVRVGHKKTLTSNKQDYSLMSSLPLFDQRPPAAKNMEVTAATNASTTIALKATDDNLPVAPGRLTYTLVSLPSHGVLQYAGGAPITAPGELAQYGSQVVYRPAIGFTGDDSFTFYAHDGGTAPTGGFSNIAEVRISVRDLLIREYQVAAGEDDASALTGYQVASGQQLWTGLYSSAMRFQNVDIPQGVQVVSAGLELFARGIVNSTGAVHAEAVGNGSNFAWGTPRVYERVKTQVSVGWNWQGTEPGNVWHSSPEIGAVIQEVIDRPDWSPGNALVIIYAGKDPFGQGTYFDSWEADSEHAAKLKITCTPKSDAGVPPEEPGRYPPAVADMEVCVPANTPMLVTLDAVDDGLPQRLSFTIDSLPSHGSLEYPSGTAITQPVVLLDHGYQVVYKPDAGFIGDDVFAFHADDGGSAPLGGVSDTATITMKARNIVTRQYQVVLPEDDAHGGDTDPIVLADLLSVGRYESALRFRNIDVPRTSEVIGAHLTIRMDTTSIEHPVDGVIRAEAVGDPAEFTEAGLRISDLPRTQAHTPWEWEAGDSWSYEAYGRSPDISGVVQEVIDRPDWWSGNSLVLLFSSDSYAGQDLQFFSCDGEYSIRAAKLDITYAPKTGTEPVLPPSPAPHPPTAQDAEIMTPLNGSVTVVLKATDDGLPAVPGGLVYKLTSLPAHGWLEYQNGEQITRPTKLIEGGNAVNYRPYPGFIGKDSFTFHADDGGTAPSGGASGTATVALTVREATTCDSVVAGSADDASALASDIQNRLNEAVLQVGRHSSGMRFKNVSLPRGSLVVSAHLRVHEPAKYVQQGVEANIHAEATGNARDFAGQDRHLGSLARTQASVRWVWSVGQYDEGWYDSPDLRELIQEVVDRPDWSRGNSIAILCSGNPSAAQDLQFHSYDGSRDYAPQLEIAYICGEQPIRYWHFDEGGGTTVHDWVGGGHGTVHGARWIAGRVGGALQFDGIDDYVALPENRPVWLPQNDFAVAFWVQFDSGDSTSSTPQHETILDLNYGASSLAANQLGCLIQRRWETKKITFLITTRSVPDELLYSQTLFARDVWYHVVAVRRGTSQELYVNGELDKRATCVSEPVDFSGYYDDDRVNIGRYTAYTAFPGYHLKGQLDEIMIFDKALSDQEISRIYNGAADGSP